MSTVKAERICKWCSKVLGVLSGWVLVCPACDYYGSAGPPEDKVRDQYPRP